MDNYERISQAGEGTYGVVIKARHKHSGMLVAIKRFKEKDEDGAVRKTALREVRILRQMHHENIVNLIEVFRQGGKLYLVFEFVDGNVLDEMERYQPAGVPQDSVRRITWQVLQALEYVHEAGIMHRDLKPENLLQTRSGIIKLCDFGFAREMEVQDALGYTDYVATRWYRSPELLVGARDYDRTVDVWAVGCLFAEMVSGAPLFPGDTDLDQLHRIVSVLGPLTKKHLDTFAANPLYEGVAIPSATEEAAAEEEEEEGSDSDTTDSDESEFLASDRHPSQQQQKRSKRKGSIGLAARLPGFGPKELSFIGHCLAMHPSGRSQCSELLKHEYFGSEWLSCVPAELHAIAERERAELVACLKRAKRLNTSLLRHLLGTTPGAEQQPGTGSSNTSSVGSPGGTAYGPGTPPSLVGSPAPAHKLAGTPSERRVSMREDMFASSPLATPLVLSAAQREHVSFAGPVRNISESNGSNSSLRLPLLPSTPRAACTVAAPRTSFGEAASHTPPQQQKSRRQTESRQRRPQTPGVALQQQQQRQQQQFPLATEYTPSAAGSAAGRHFPAVMAAGDGASTAMPPPAAAAAPPGGGGVGPKLPRTVMPITTTKTPWGSRNPLPTIAGGQTTAAQTIPSGQDGLSWHMRKHHQQQQPPSLTSTWSGIRR